MAHKSELKLHFQGHEIFSSWQQHTFQDGSLLDLPLLRGKGHKLVIQLWLWSYSVGPTSCEPQKWETFSFPKYTLLNKKKQTNQQQWWKAFNGHSSIYWIYRSNSSLKTSAKSFYFSVLIICLLVWGFALTIQMQEVKKLFSSDLLLRSTGCLKQGYEV